MTIRETIADLDAKWRSTTQGEGMVMISMADLKHVVDASEGNRAIGLNTYFRLKQAHEAELDRLLAKAGEE